MELQLQRFDITPNVELRLKGQLLDNPDSANTVTLLLRFFRVDADEVRPLQSWRPKSKAFPDFELYKIGSRKQSGDRVTRFAIDILPPPEANLVELGVVSLKAPDGPVEVSVDEIRPLKPGNGTFSSREKRGTWPRTVLGKTNISEELVSVIIPVYNDAEGLRKCLHALSVQEPRRGGYEVIVVDNASTEDIKSVVDQFPNVKYLLHKKPGSYSSRNFGALHAAGSVLAFTDGDCVPAQDWLKKGAYQLLSSQTPRIVTGRIVLTWLNGKGPRTIAGWWERIFGFNYQRLGLLGQPYIKHGVTASMFMLRDTFDKLGGFTEDHFSGGDTDFSNRCNARGIKVRFEPDVVVAHPAREDTKALLKKRLRIFSNLYYRELDKA
ncbi:glycosyltransferase, partial [Bifidobacterium longum]|uniref:glycosyltransferase family 2 protein n=1 Tax=Bifidobacterium longum TaxID=216816 RepID=UPI002570620F